MLLETVETITCIELHLELHANKQHADAKKILSEYLHETIKRLILFLEELHEPLSHLYALKTIYAPFSFVKM